MNSFIKFLGIFTLIFGFTGGFAYTAETFNLSWLDELTKDQVLCLFGLTWIWLSDKNKI